MRFFALTVIFSFLFVFFAVPLDNGKTMFEAVKTRPEFQSFLDTQQPVKVNIPSEDPVKRLPEISENTQNTSDQTTNGTPEDRTVSQEADSAKNEPNNDPEDASPSLASFEELSVHGVLEWTNYYRVRNDLKPLQRNPLLVTAATIKVYDMLNDQYFEHVAPDGTDVSDVVRGVNYNYIAIGENLALGDFHSSKDLVDAWMDSPGHRENILNPSYEDIGIALKYGEIEGTNAWLAAQAFAKPRSSCPTPDYDLKDRISSGKEQIKILSEKLDVIRVQLEEMDHDDSERYNEKVQEYNDLANEINSLNKKLKKFTTRYNSQVDIFNKCAST